MYESVLVKSPTIHGPGHCPAAKVPGALLALMADDWTCADCKAERRARDLRNDTQRRWRARNKPAGGPLPLAAQRRRADGVR